MVTLPIRSILAATDLTNECDEVLRAGAGIARLSGAELHLLHAFDLESAPRSAETRARPSFQGRFRDAERALDEQIRCAVPEEVPVASREIVIYDAHRAIEERAAAVSADLILLGPHRRRSLASRFLGSTADRVIRTAEVPCLIVRGALAIPLRRVVVPVDLSEPARGALDHALAWSASFGSEPGPSLRPGVTVSVVYVIPETGGADRAGAEEALRREVDAAVARSGAGEETAVQAEVLQGDLVAKRIIQLAERADADLVVLGTHGYGAAKRALVGGVASAVAREAACAVLLVPPALWQNASA